MKIVIQQIETGRRRMKPDIQWHLTMGDDDHYQSDKPLDTKTFLECVGFGHEGQEDADHGILHIRLTHDTELCIAFTVE